MHAVFLNEQYNDPDEAKAKSGGVTVIAVQVQVGVWLIVFLSNVRG